MRTGLELQGRTWCFLMDVEASFVRGGVLA